jgi:hypothetical protein
MTRQEIAATIIEDMRRGYLEVQGLQRCEHDHDFDALVSDIIDDLEILAAKYRGLLQALYEAPEPGQSFDHEQAIQEYTALMEAGPLAENEPALRMLVEQAHAQGLYFEYDRDAQKYRLVSPESLLAMERRDENQSL